MTTTRTVDGAAPATAPVAAPAAKAPVAAPAAKAPLAAPAAKAPLAAPAATTVSVVLALVLVGAGIVAGRDALIGFGAITGAPWIAAGLKAIDGLTAQSWMRPAGIVVAMIGLLLLLAAIKPRKRTHVPTNAPDAWITPRDVRRVARTAALSLTGVDATTASGSARSLTLSITPVNGYDTSQLDESVRSVVTESLSSLANPPRLKTRLKKRDSS